MDAVAVPRTVEQTAERLDITDKLTTPAGELSRDQRQHVAIGQALIHAPEVLILDEPASGLDPEARHVLACLFMRLQSEDMTLIVSSHILAELDEYSTHLLVLRSGKVIENRPLGGAPIAGSRVRVELATPVAGWHERARECVGVRLLEADASTGVLVVVSGTMAQASVLKHLIDAGLPVAGFHAERENLHDSYLRTVREGRQL
jgi:ABC-2 type transport system ATP-binding protein